MNWGAKNSCIEDYKGTGLQSELGGGVKTAVLKIIKELGYRLKCGVKNSCIEDHKGTELQSELWG